MSVKCTNKYKVIKESIEYIEEYEELSNSLNEWVTKSASSYTSILNSELNPEVC